MAVKIETGNQLQQKTIPFGESPKWVKRYPGTFMANLAGNTIATYDPATDEVKLSVYRNTQEFERERNYCHLWIVNGGRGVLVDV